MNTRGVALYGASIQTRVVATLGTKASSLFTKRDNPLQFFDTEPVARQWIKQRQKVILQEATGGKNV
jgi:hypothetical protein